MLFERLVSLGPDVALDFLLDKLRSNFEGGKASDSTIYNFFTNICMSSLKRLSIWFEKRDLEDLKHERFGGHLNIRIQSALQRTGFPLMRLTLTSMLSGNIDVQK